MTDRKKRDIRQGFVERAAWQRVADYYESVTGEGLDLDKHRPLVAYIRFWGEELAALRQAQSEWDSLAARRVTLGQEASVLIERGLTL